MRSEGDPSLKNGSPFDLGALGASAVASLAKSVAAGAYASATMTSLRPPPRCTIRTCAPTRSTSAGTCEITPT